MWLKPETVQWFTACSVLTILTVFLVGSCLWVTSGCTITIADKGEVGIQLTQGIRFYSGASQTKGESQLSADAKSLVEHVTKLGWAGPDATTNGGP